MAFMNLSSTRSPMPSARRSRRFIIIAATRSKWSSSAGKSALRTCIKQPNMRNAGRARGPSASALSWRGSRPSASMISDDAQLRSTIQRSVNTSPPRLPPPPPRPPPPSPAPSPPHPPQHHPTHPPPPPPPPLAPPPLYHTPPPPPTPPPP